MAVAADAAACPGLVALRVDFGASPVLVPVRACGLGCDSATAALSSGAGTAGIAWREGVLVRGRRRDLDLDLERGLLRTLPAVVVLRQSHSRSLGFHIDQSLRADDFLGGGHEVIYLFFECSELCLSIEGNALVASLA